MNACSTPVRCQVNKVLLISSRRHIRHRTADTPRNQKFHPKCMRRIASSQYRVNRSAKLRTASIFKSWAWPREQLQVLFFSAWVLAILVGSVEADYCAVILYSHNYKYDYHHYDHYYFIIWYNTSLSLSLYSLYVRIRNEFSGQTGIKAVPGLFKVVSPLPLQWPMWPRPGAESTHHDPILRGRVKRCEKGTCWTWWKWQIWMPTTLAMNSVSALGRHEPLLLEVDGH